MPLKTRALWLIAAGLVVLTGSGMEAMQTDDPNPPDEVVRLIFIHHSTGENWLRDDYGNLGRALGENNYFVSDTNYGWGPEAIGDRTDITNWTEWFRSENTPLYMEALYQEGGQNSSYTRRLMDPGGENQIIVFKSCFPNSALEGKPDDPPGSYEELSVGGAKYVYNQILQYFATRPEKLFVVITAPPLTDPTYAQNARAFNDWLLNDWLHENQYSLLNVAIFDFYNVLTGMDAHHRIQNGSEEHIAGVSNTLVYPSEDDHPSAAGSQKATQEFIPLLNSFYHRWQAARYGKTGDQPPVPNIRPEQISESGAAVIDDFESGPLAGTGYWQAYFDEATASTAACATQGSSIFTGTGALQIDFNVAANSWVTCALFYDQAQDWTYGEGLTFHYRVDQPGLVFDVDLYAGDRDNRETYLYTIESPSDGSEEWNSMLLSWGDFHRADWEADAGAVFDDPDQIIGLAFGMNTYPDTPNSGSLWIDDIGLAGLQTVNEEQHTDEEQDPGAGRRRLLPCSGAIGVPLGLMVIGVWRKNRRKKSVKTGA